MSEAKQPIDEQLITDIDDAEDPKDDSDTGTDTESELFEGEQDENESSEEQSSKPDLSASKQKQIDAWVGKILAEEATIADLPKNMSWLKTPVLKELKSLEMTPELEARMEAIADKKLQEKEESLEFDRLKADLNSMDLTKGQQAELSAEFKDLVAAGLSKTKALTKAMKIAGITVDKYDLETDELRRSMSIPRGGNSPEDIDDKNPENVLKKFSTSEERIKYWEKLRKKDKLS